MLTLLGYNYEIHFDINSPLTTDVSEKHNLNRLHPVCSSEQSFRFMLSLTLSRHFY